WFSHGRSQTDNPWQVPLEPGDTWHENPMRIFRVAQDPTRTSADDGKPPTRINTETHWWDASQLYGSSQPAQDYIRLKAKGYVKIGRDHILNPDDAQVIGQPLLAGWWLGQSLMYTLFALEHNAICDALQREYPHWGDDELFDHARLINAALIAKIHTVEWTTALLSSPTLKIAMNANWWGVAGETVKKLFGRISSSEIISGIPGGRTDHFGVPYAITEEFVAVYRMHPLLPDDLTFRSVADDRVLQQRGFGEIAGVHARERLNEMSMLDIFYSFGRMNPGAIQLHNFPRALQEFERPDGVVIDLAAHDILRSRELGVPRYNEFRRLLHLKPFATFEEMTPNTQWAAEMRRVYDGDVDKVDLTVGMFAEQPPPGFAFSDTAFRIFILMASRRLNSDRFFTTDFTSEVYTPLGMDWIDDNTFATILLRHYPALAPALRNVGNPFAPWAQVAAGVAAADARGTAASGAAPIPA
ncbi:MAG: heme peroxidase, partial [Candidatus Eremiobacteraeota bacterium]|nr:heme peroxidase [Candidatus Eremiobacteraeota bacterium]